MDPRFEEGLGRWMPLICGADGDLHASSKNPPQIYNERWPEKSPQGAVKKCPEVDSEGSKLSGWWLVREWMSVFNSWDSAFQLKFENLSSLFDIWFSNFSRHKTALSLSSHLLKCTWVLRQKRMTVSELKSCTPVILLEVSPNALKPNYDSRIVIHSTIDGKLAGFAIISHEVICYIKRFEIL